MTTWTKERTDRLRELLVDRLSASQIAADLGGVSRNGIIGKVHRLGLTLNGRRMASTKPRSRARTAISALKIAARKGMALEGGNGETEFLVIVDTDIPIAQRRTLFELTSETCRWPVGDPNSPDFFFCGAEPIAGCVYCAPHTRRGLIGFSSVPRGGDGS